MTVEPDRQAASLMRTVELDDAPTVATWCRRRLAVGTAAGSVWEADSDAADLIPVTGAGHDAAVRRLVRSEASGLLSLGADGSVRRGSTELVAAASIPGAVPAQDICWTSDGATAVVAVGTRLLLDHRAPLGVPTLGTEQVPVGVGFIRRIAPSRRHLVLVGGAGGVAWVDARLGVVDHLEPCPPVVALAADPTGRFLAAADVTGDLHLMPIAGGPTQVVGGYPDRVDILDWTADGSHLLAVADDEVTAWPVSEAGITTERPISLLADAGRITALTPAPQGLQVATGHVDGEVLCWRLPDGDRWEAPCVGAEVTCLAWSPDAHTLAVGAIDGTLHRLALSTPEPGDPTCP